MNVIHYTVFTITIPEEKMPKGITLKIHKALRDLGVLENTKIDGYSKQEEEE